MSALWVKLLEQGFALALALGVTYLQSKGSSATLDSVSRDAQKYIADDAKALSDAEDSYVTVGPKTPTT